MAAPSSAPRGTPGASGVAAPWWALAAVFFVSGGAALVLQVVWLRKLALVFGVTSHASSAIVSSYMAGLALGGLVGGALADRVRRPLALLAVLDLAIAGYALASEGAFARLHAAIGALGIPFEARGALAAVSFLGAMAVLIVPTVLMGATLPAIGRAGAPRGHDLGRVIGRLNLANGVGAALGAFAGGFVLLEHLGVRGTTHAGAAGYGLAAALAAWLAWRCDGASAPTSAGEVREPRAALEVTAAQARAALVFLSVIGFTGLALETTWIRLLVLYVGTNVYAFAAIVSVFLLALAVGSGLMSRRVTGLERPLATLARLGLGIAAYVAFSLLLIGFPLVVARALPFIAGLGFDWLSFTIGNVTIAAVMMAVPIVLLGAAMPLVAHVVRARPERVGRTVGWLAFVDTAGAVLAPPLTAFALLPALGVKGTLLALGGLAGCAGAALAVVSGDRSRGTWTTVAATAAVGVAIMASGAPGRPLVDGLATLRPVKLFEDAAALRPPPDWVHRAEAALSPVVRAYAEGMEATVAVVEHPGVRALTVNGIACSDDSEEGLSTQTMIVHVPLLLAPDPSDVLVIGLGIGFTTRAAQAHGVNVDVVELEKREVDVRHAFGAIDRAVRDDPRVELHFGDGRAFVERTERRYDVVQPGIIHPAFSSGNAGFYSYDFYESCKRILKPGGLVAQWLPLEGVEPGDFKALVRTFQAAFPHTTLWYKWSPTFCVLVGSPDRLVVDWERFAARAAAPAIQADLAASHAQGALALLDGLFLDEDAVRAYVGSGPIQTDDRPLSEFASGRILYFDPVRFSPLANVRGLAPFRSPVWPSVRAAAGPVGDALRAELERAARASAELVRGHLLELEGNEAAATAAWDASWTDTDASRRALEAYERALAIAPEDQAARFQHRNLAARLSLARGLEAIRQLDFASAARLLVDTEGIDPGSRAAAWATALREALPSGTGDAGAANAAGGPSG